MKPRRYAYEFRDGKHGFVDRCRFNFWKNTCFTTESRARMWIAEKNREEGREC